MDKTDRIYVAGGETLVGKGLLRELDLAGYSNVVDTSSVEPDLTDGRSVDAYFEATRPDYVFLTAGKSGGIGANQRYPADLMLNNLLIQCQIIRSAQRHAVRKLLYLASSCTYPRSSPQPMQVRSLMTGPLESTSEAYAMAKIAGIKLCQAYRRQHGADMVSVIPGDVFGPGDDFVSTSPWSQRNAGPTGIRFRLLETLRQYGGERLEDHGDIRTRSSSRPFRSGCFRCFSRHSGRVLGRLRLTPASSTSRTTSVPRSFGLWRSVTSPVRTSCVTATGAYAHARILHEHGDWVHRALEQWHAVGTTAPSTSLFGWAAYWETRFVNGDRQKADHARRGGNPRCRDAV